MAEEEKKAGEGEAQAAPAAKSHLIKWAVIGAVLLLFLGLEVGLAIFFVNKLKPEDETVKALQIHIHHLMRQTMGRDHPVHQPGEDICAVKNVHLVPQAGQLNRAAQSAGAGADHGHPGRVRVCRHLV